MRLNELAQHRFAQHTPALARVVLEQAEEIERLKKALEEMVEDSRGRAYEAQLRGGE